MLISMDRERMKIIPDPSVLLTVAHTYASDITDFLSDLVRIPSVNGRDTEYRVAERIQTEASKLGLSHIWLLVKLAVPTYS